MNAAGISPLERVLRLVAEVAPQPWYPREYVRAGAMSGERLSFIIEHLLLEELLQRTPGTKQSGPGVQLTPRGVAVLNDPEMLAKLCTVQPLADGDRGGVVRWPQAAPAKDTLLLAVFSSA